jgi:hypothetical protein
LSEFQSSSRRIFIGSHSLPPLWSPNRSFTGALHPGDEPPSPGRQDHPLTTRARHDYSSRLRTLELSRLAPRPGSLASGDHLQSEFWQRVLALPSSRRGGFSDGHLRRLGGSSGSLLSLRCHIFNGHRRRDIASLGLSTCRQLIAGSVIPGGYDYSSRSFALEQSTHLQRRWPQAT